MRLASPATRLGPFDGELSKRLSRNLASDDTQTDGLQVRLSRQNVQLMKILAVSVNLSTRLLENKSLRLPFQQHHRRIVVPPGSAGELVGGNEQGVQCLVQRQLDRGPE